MHNMSEVYAFVFVRMCVCVWVSKARSADVSQRRLQQRRTVLGGQTELVGPNHVCIRAPLISVLSLPLASTICLTTYYLGAASRAFKEAPTAAEAHSPGYQRGGPHRNDTAQGQASSIISSSRTSGFLQSTVPWTQSLRVRDSRTRVES